MPLTIQCDCGTRITAQDDEIGTQVPCPHCGAAIEIADPNAKTCPVPTFLPPHTARPHLTVSSIDAAGAIGNCACPACAETIKSAARVCRFCGHQLSDHEIMIAKQAAMAAAKKRDASLDAARRQEASKKARSTALVCSVFGWILAAFWGLMVFGSFGAYFTGSTAGDGQPMTFGGLIGGLVCFTIPFGLPAFFLLRKAGKLKTESRNLISNNPNTRI